MNMELHCTVSQFLIWYTCIIILLIMLLGITRLLTRPWFSSNKSESPFSLYSVIDIVWFIYLLGFIELVKFVVRLYIYCLFPCHLFYLKAIDTFSAHFFISIFSASKQVDKMGHVRHHTGMYLHCLNPALQSSSQHLKVLKRLLQYIHPQVMPLQKIALLNIYVKLMLIMQSKNMMKMIIQAFTTCTKNFKTIMNYWMKLN